MTTTALLCVARNELPFTAEWLEHHFSLGFNRVYYVSTDLDFGPVRAFFDRSPFRSRVELTHFEDLSPGWQVRCYNQQLARVREDWVLPLDVDEFLYLQGRGSIQEYLESQPGPVGQIQFPWLNLISDAYGHDRTFELTDRSARYASDHVKSLARVRDVSRLGVHAHVLRHATSCLSSGREASASSRHGFLLEDPQSWIRHPLILHFCARGHMDVLMRIAEQGFHNAKCGSNEHQRLRRYLIGPATWANLPTRYLLLQLWQAMPQVDLELSLPELSARTEGLEMKAMFRRSMSRLLGFEGPVEDVAERFEARYALERKLRGHGGAARFTAREYLKYPTPVAYLEARRTALERQPEGRGQAGPSTSKRPEKQRKPVFIHISKNAGSSIASSAAGRIINAGHRTAASWLRENGGDSGDGHRLFAVIRNPFDRVVSEYFYRKRRHDAGDSDPHLANLDLSFEDWVLATFRDGAFRTRAFFEATGIAFNERNMIEDRLIWFVPQMEWLGDGQGRLLVTDLLRFENLKWDWSHYAEKHALNRGLARRNASPRGRDYRPHYSDEARELVARYYREDLEAFGYVF